MAFWTQNRSTTAACCAATLLRQDARHRLAISMPNSPENCFCMRSLNSRDTAKRRIEPKMTYAAHHSSLWMSELPE